MKRLTVSLVAVLMICAGCASPAITPATPSITPTPTDAPYKYPPVFWLMVDGQRAEAANFQMVTRYDGSIADYPDPDPQVEATMLGPEGIVLEIDGNLPKKLHLSLTPASEEGTNSGKGYSQLSISLTGRHISWKPEVQPGKYFLGIGTVWTDERLGVDYWLAVEFK